MYVIIVGAGEVGSYLAEILIAERHDVAIIESNESLVRQLETSMDALIIHGTGVSRQSLKQAGISKADLVLAVTQVDEVNLMACMAAAKFGKSPRTVARVRNTAFLGADSPLTAEELGISMLVGPEPAVANEVVNVLSYEGAGDYHTLADGQIALLELPLSQDSPLVHETLGELRDTLPNPSLIAAVRGPNGLQIPSGNYRMRADERAFILTPPQCVDEFWILSGTPWHHVRHALIIGCGNIGYHLAKALETKQLFPTIIESDKSRATWLSKAFSKSIVLHGDGSDPDLLREQLEERSDAVVVLLKHDADAILCGLFAKQLGAKKVVVRSNKLAYASITNRLGIDSLISPRRAVAEEILRFVRRGHVSAARMLGDHEGEILELQIPQKPRHKEILERPLHALTFPPGALLGAVIRDGKAAIATGDTIMQPGDGVLVVSLPSAIDDIAKLLG